MEHPGRFSASCGITEVGEDDLRDGSGPRIREPGFVVGLHHESSAARLRQRRRHPPGTVLVQEWHFRDELRSTCSLATCVLWSALKRLHLIFRFLRATGMLRGLITPWPPRTRKLCPQTLQTRSQAHGPPEAVVLQPRYLQAACLASYTHLETKSSTPVFALSNTTKTLWFSFWHPWKADV